MPAHTRTVGAGLDTVVGAVRAALRGPERPAQAHPAADRPGTRRRAGSAQPPGDAAGTSRPGPLVLVCEDDPLVSEFFRDALAAFGCRAVGAPDGEAALRLAAELRPAAIVLDLALPGLDGGATLMRLKADRRTAAIPVVVASAHPGWLTFLDRRQVVAVLEKPCLPAELHAAVQQALAPAPVG